ncbi:MAG: hypothetical protein ACRDTG_27610 [Pseudonocardiaceae bacterium]
MSLRLQEDYLHHECHLPRDGSRSLRRSAQAAPPAVTRTEVYQITAASLSIAQAGTGLDRGRRGDEPFWLDFWGPADLAWHETRVALTLGRAPSRRRPPGTSFAAAARQILPASA